MTNELYESLIHGVTLQWGHLDEWICCGVIQVMVLHDLFRPAAAVSWNPLNEASRGTGCH
jgi:hypothetical protein